MARILSNNLNNEIVSQTRGIEGKFTHIFMFVEMQPCFATNFCCTKEKLDFTVVIFDCMLIFSIV